MEGTPTAPGIENDAITVRIPATHKVTTLIQPVLMNLLRNHCGIPCKTPIDIKTATDEAGGLQATIHISGMMNGTRAAIVEQLAQAGYVEETGHPDSARL